MLFGNFIDRRLNQIHMTQRELADQLSDAGYEMNPSRVAHWKSGRNRPPIDDPTFARVLAQILKMSVTDMFRALGYDVGKSQLSEDAIQAADIVEQLKPELRQIALALLKSLQEQDG